MTLTIFYKLICKYEFKDNFMSILINLIFTSKSYLTFCLVYVYTCVCVCICVLIRYCFSPCEFMYNSACWISKIMRWNHRCNISCHLYFSLKLVLYSEESHFFIIHCIWDSKWKWNYLWSISLDKWSDFRSMWGPNSERDSLGNRRLIYFMSWISK